MAATIDKETSLTVLNISFNGRNGVGVISLPGLKIGDVVFATSKESGGDYEPFSGPVLSVVKVDDELYQYSTGNLTGNDFKALVYRGV